MNTIKAETERFYLRELEAADAEDMFELDSDPAVHRYLGNNPVNDLERIHQVIAHVQAQYQKNGIGRWAVIEKTSGEFLGWSGLKLEEESAAGYSHYYDIGYRIKQKHWGKGVASETALVCRDYAFTTLQVPRLYAAAHVENLASNRVLQKIGMQFEKEFFWEDIPCNWYSLGPEGLKK